MASARSARAGSVRASTEYLRCLSEFQADPEFGERACGVGRPSCCTEVPEPLDIPLGAGNGLETDVLMP